MYFKNTQKIDTIEMFIKGARSFCPLGNASYTHNFMITMSPNELIPDYIFIDNWVKENFNENKPHIIEDAVKELADYLLNTYKLEYVRVRDLVKDAAHSTVIVSIERSIYNAVPING